MGVKRAEDLLLWQRARELVVAVSPFLQRSSFRHDATLRSQLNASSTSVLFDISEGFGQPTDRAFARYLYISRASSAEARAQLLVAMSRGYITEAEFESCREVAKNVERMATGLIRHLRREDRKDRR